MTSRLLQIALLLQLVLSAAALQADEWTRFRGPNGAGASAAANIPDQWTDADYRWKVQLPGIGHSSPVLWGDKIFLTSADPNTGMRIALCITAADGLSAANADSRIVWQAKFPSSTHHIHTQNSFASSTPAVDADHVYVAWATPEEFAVVALDHSGKQAWRVELGPYLSQHGYASSPIVYEDLLIVTNDQDGTSFLTALDCKTGETRWKVPRRAKAPQNASYATPCVFQPAGGEPELIVNNWAHGISSLDPRTGKTNWELPVFERRAISSPILAAGLIFGSCGEGSGDNYVVAVRPGSKGRPAELAYKIDRSTAPYVPTMVAKDDLIFLWSDKGIVSCVDAATGKLHWKERVGGNYSGSPVLVGDRLYCISADGEVVVLAAADTYKLLGRTPLGEGSRSTPAVVDGVMYLRTESQLFALGGNSKSR